MPYAVVATSLVLTAAAGYVSVGLVGYGLVRIIASVIERAFHGLVRAAAAPLNPAGNP
jgi:hypothetical protein